jgi:hypothetical protein
MAEQTYISKAVPTKISATSRVAIKIKDNFYTVEYSEERTIPDIEGVSMETERSILFNDVNAIVDEQAEEIIKTFRKS